MSVVRQYETYEQIQVLDDRQLANATALLESEIVALSGKLALKREDSPDWQRRAEQALKSLKLRLSWAERETKLRRIALAEKYAISETGVFKALVRKQLGEEAYVRLWDEARRIARTKEPA